MTPLQFVHTLQISDSLFPVGAFAYSDGLECAVAGGHVKDAVALATWMDHFLHGVFVPCDGLAALKSASAARRDDWAAIRNVDEELTALKPSAAVRASSRSIGKRLLKTYGSAFRDDRVAAFGRSMPDGNAAVVYGVVLSSLGMDNRDVLLAFGYARLAGIVSAGMRLIALGQQQAQELLTASLISLPVAVERVLQMECDPLRSFGPFMDIQQMNHRYVYSRLFRS